MVFNNFSNFILALNDINPEAAQWLGRQVLLYRDNPRHPECILTKDVTDPRIVKRGLISMFSWHHELSIHIGWAALYSTMNKLKEKKDDV